MTEEEAIAVEEERDTYLKEAKRKALALMDRGDYIGAAISMTVDMKAREDTRPSEWLIDLVRSYIGDGDLNGVRRWIQGFR